MKSRLLIVLIGFPILATLLLGKAQPLAAQPPLESPLATNTVTYRAVTVSAGLNHTCAVTSGGAVLCWGDNVGGQLGDNSTTRRLVPVPVSGLSSGVIAVASGWYHTCALMSNGGVMCWGTNSHGQLGDGTTAAHLTPVPVIGLTSPVIAISAGKNYTCAITSDGGAKCWGENLYGQLGVGGTADRWVPTPVWGLSSGVARIRAGQVHTCALLTNGGVRCWGYNYFGQLGNNSNANSDVPVWVDGLTTGVTEIAVGWHHTCAVLANGEAKCWGRNEYGTLGDGQTVNSKTPVSVRGLMIPLTAIAAGFSHTCGLTSATGVKCWGANFSGQLGDLTWTNSVTPTNVSELYGVTTLTAGQHHNCVRTANGGLKCWGHNYNGQVGDNSTTNRNAPVCVRGFFCPPQDAIRRIIANVNTLVATGVLNQGQGNALIAKLDAAIRKLDDDNFKTAANQLQAFINQVNDLINQGVLPPTKGQPLIDAANEIIATLGR